MFFGKGLGIVAIALWLHYGIEPGAWESVLLYIGFMIAGDGIDDIIRNHYQLLPPRSPESSDDAGP